MKKSAGQIAVVLICAFLFPYIVTLFVSGKVDILKNNGLYSGKQVRLEDGTSVMDVEEYLIGMVASQIPAKYNEEAIKAQAVIARTYIYKVLNGQSVIDETSLNVDPLSIVEMEEIWGENNFQDYYSKIEEAVKATSKQVLLYQNQYIDALYHSVSSGKTRKDESGLCPYLAVKDSPYDIEADGYLQMKVMELDAFVERINAIDASKQVKVENVLSNIQIIAKDESGYVEKLQIDGCEFSGVSVADALGLASSSFSFEDYEGKIRVVAKGIGHGYGLSQWGADRMGVNGAKYMEILKYYYTNIEIKAV